ncbi:ribokinase [Vallicoccus soli]|uniref:Ribokinase n=1 Tax=Vallicoccus soli TaxID=2339232 RepID=A0A3A3YX96_9ACTN|nr:ribokinase [Vallicoccus soli]RJK92615.1 ribokinase [Vallicoccus soli]
MGRVAVVGSLNVDLVTGVERHPRPGETVRGEGLEHRPGGKGANQALAAARAGARTTLVGRVGDDAAGSSYLIGLRREDVDVSRVRRTRGTPTGHALIVVDGSGENTIVIAAGANGELTPDDVEDCADVVREADVLLLQLEVPLPAVEAAARLARGAGTRVLLNPSPVTALGPSLLDHVDLVVANEDEARSLGGWDGPLITTLGARGARWRAPRVDLHRDALRVDVVDTTGAGDALAGAVAAALADGLDEAAALERGVAAGARAATHDGAQDWLLD